MKRVRRGKAHTGASIQARNCVSIAWHPATLYPADAQHAVFLPFVLAYTVRNSERFKAGGRD